jgi:hypothetical protein
MTNNYSKQPNKKLKKCYRVSYNWSKVNN